MFGTKIFSPSIPILVGHCVCNKQNVNCSHPLSVATHKTARTGGHNARKQSNNSKMQESRFSSINVQSARERLNPQATSARGHVIVAQGSATPESSCSLTNSRTDDDIDKRSVDFDGAVHKKISRMARQLFSARTNYSL